MFHSQASNNKISLLHERALRMIFNDQYSSFEELREKSNSFTVHDFSIQSLSIEMFEVKNNIAPTIIDDLFTRSHVVSAKNLYQVKASYIISDSIHFLML